MARWTDLATWRGPTPNQTRGHVECRGLVVHIAQGGYEGTIAWQKNPAAQVSSHFVVAKSGDLAQVVDTDDTAWTQAAGNGHWLSVECEGFVPTALTAAQVEAVAQLLARGHAQYGYPLQIATTPTGKGLGHHAMGGLAWGGHLDCPGPNIIAQKPAIVARAQQIAGGGAVTDPYTTQEQAGDDDLRWRVDAIWSDSPVLRGGRYLDTADLNRNMLHEHLLSIDAKLAEIKAMLAAGGGGAGPTAAEIAKAVNDDTAVRMAP